MGPHPCSEVRYAIRSCQSITLEVPDKDGVPPTVLHPQIPTDIGTLKRSWAQLQEERDSYRERFNEQEQKIQKLTKQLENERILNDYIRTEKKRPWEH